jgi:hypothetical protein
MSRLRTPAFCAQCCVVSQTNSHKRRPALWWSMHRFPPVSDPREIRRDELENGRTRESCIARPGTPRSI